MIFTFMFLPLLFKEYLVIYDYICFWVILTSAPGALVKKRKKKNYVGKHYFLHFQDFDYASSKIFILY